MCSPFSGFWSGQASLWVRSRLFYFPQVRKQKSFLLSWLTIYFSLLLAFLTFVFQGKFRSWVQLNPRLSKVVYPSACSQFIPCLHLLGPALKGSSKSLMWIFTWSGPSSFVVALMEWEPQIDVGRFSVPCSSVGCFVQYYILFYYLRSCSTGQLGVWLLRVPYHRRAGRLDFFELVFWQSIPPPSETCKEFIWFPPPLFLFFLKVFLAFVSFIQ